MDLRIRTDTSDLTRFIEACDRVEAALDRGYDQAARELSSLGLRAAKKSARVTAGEHARGYAAAGRREREGSGQYFYGPILGGQGNLAPILEYGSRTSPAHLDYTESADLVTAESERVAGRHVDEALREL